MITRRGLLGLALAVIPGAKLLAKADLRVDEYVIGYDGFESLVVKVWSNCEITVSKGSEQLIPTVDDDGWLEFLGKYGTRISLRIKRPRELEVGYFAIVEPNGTDVEDVDYLAPGQYEKFGFPCNV